MKRFKTINISMSVIKACSIGVVASILTAIAMGMIAPIFIINEYCDLGMMQWICAVIQLVSTFVGAILSGVLSKDNTLVAAVISSLSWFAFLICAGILLFDAPIRGVATEGIASLIGCAMAIIVLIRQYNTPVRRKKARRIR